MKKIAKLSYSCLALIILISLGNISAQSSSIKEVFEWSHKLDKNGNIEFENYDCNLVIHSWDKAEVSFKLQVDGSFRNETGANKLKDHLRELDFSGSAENLFFNNRFWSSKKNIAGIKTMKLEGNGNILYKELNIKGELWIPADAYFKLKSKYSSINLEDLNGKLDLNLYNDKIEGKNALNDVSIDAKYSTIDFGNFGNLEANIYDCNLTYGNSQDAHFTSKYSEIICKNTGNLEIESYDDKFKFDSTGDIVITAKYTDLKSDVSGKILIDYYDGSIETNECKDIDIKSKYSKYTMGKTSDWTVRSSFDDKYLSDNANSINISESKYSEYKINNLVGSLTLLNGYDDKFIIPKIRSGFGEISINGKYVKSEFGFDEDASFRIKANIKYPHLDINEDKLSVRISISESSQLEYEAIKGTESSNMSLINISGYDMSLKINN